MKNSFQFSLWSNSTIWSPWKFSIFLCFVFPGKVSIIYINIYFFSANVVLETSRFIVLYIDFYVPYMFALYMLFGGPTELFGDTKKDIEKKNYKLEKFGDVVSFSYSNVMYDKNWIEMEIRICYISS